MPLLVPIGGVNEVYFFQKWDALKSVKYVSVAHVNHAFASAAAAAHSLS